MIIKEGKTNKKYLLIVIILALVVAGGTSYLVKKQEISFPSLPEQKAKDKTTDWNIYKNEEYGLEFKHPKDWMKKAICDESFCLQLIDYEKLPTEKEYISEGIGEEISTKEVFTKYKENIEKGVLPPGYLEGWKFIEIDGRKAIQIISYNIPSGFYNIETKLFTDDVGIILTARLPIEPYLKEELAPGGYPVIDIEKNQEREKDLQKGLYPNKETEIVISNYNKMLSTFRFLENETTNWKTYRNEEYWFELKYPYEYDDYSTCKLKEIDDKVLIGDRFSIEIKDAEGLILVEYINKLIEEMEIKEVLREEILIDGNKGVMISSQDSVGRSSYFTFFLKNNKIYQISFYSSIRDCWKYEENKDGGWDYVEKKENIELPNELDIFEQIPYTFKFLD